MTCNTDSFLSIRFEHERGIQLPVEVVLDILVRVGGQQAGNSELLRALPAEVVTQTPKTVPG